MAFEVETPSETQAKVRIRVPREEVDEALAHEIGHLQERARIPGFRPGKVPKKLLEKRVGGSLSLDVRRRLVAEAFEAGVNENHLHPVEPPRLEDKDLELKEDGSLAVDFDLEVFPHVDPKDYDRFNAKPPPVDLREGDVEREIEGLRRQAAQMEEVADGLAAAGDVVIADLVLQFLDGSALPPFENRIIDTGAGLVDGVECPDAKSKFIGARRGAVVKVSMKLPDQFPPDHPLAEHHGKTAVTDCTVKDLRRVALPEVSSPEFLAQFGAKDVDDLKQKVSARLMQMLRSEQDRALEELCVDELLERNRFTLPPAYLQRTVESELERIRKDAAGRGIPPEQVEREILEKEGQLRASVERRLRATYLLDRLAEKLETPVSAQELEQQFMFMAQAWQVDAQKLFDQFQSQGLLPRVAEDIRRAKVRRQLRQAAAAADNDPGKNVKATTENAP